MQPNRELAPVQPAAVQLAPPPSDPEAQRRRQALRAMFRGRWHWAIVLALVWGIAGGILGHVLVQPRYRSVGYIRITPVIPRVLYASEDNRLMPMFEAYLSLQVAMVSSQRVLETALQSETWRTVDPDASVGDVSDFAEDLLVEADPHGDTITVTYSHPDPAAARAGVRAVIEAYALVFEEREARHDSKVVQTLEQRRILLTRQLKALRAKQHSLSNEFGAAAVEQRYAAKLEELQDIERMIQETQMSLAVTGLPVQPEQEPAPAADADEVTDAMIAQIAAIDPRMQRYVDSRVELETQIENSRRLGLRNSHPTMARMNNQLAELNAQLQGYAKRIASQLDRTQATGVVAIDQLRNRERDLGRLAQKTNSQIMDLARQRMELANVDEEIAIVRQRLDDTGFRIEQLGVEAAVDGRLEILSLGNDPGAAYNLRQRKQLTAVCGVAGAGVGVGVIFLLGLLNQRLRHVDETSIDLPMVPVLGVLPALRPEYDQPLRIQMAAYGVHYLRTIMQLGKDPHRRVFVVTSPSAGSGKTSLTMALGLAFAAAESRTLIIDADTVGRGLSRHLPGMPNGNGHGNGNGNGNGHRKDQAAMSVEPSTTPTEDAPAESGGALWKDGREAWSNDKAENKRDLYAHILSRSSGTDAPDRAAAQNDAGSPHPSACAFGHAPFHDLVRHSGVKNLHVLPIPADAAHMCSMSPAAMRQIIACAREAYDTVLIDTGPALGNPDTAMVATEADGVLMVVSRGDDKKLVRKSLEQLAGIGANVLGLVFNRASTNDVEQSSYASTSTGGASRNGSTLPIRIVAHTAARRFGPLGSAVAACTWVNEEQESAAATPA